MALLAHAKIQNVKASIEKYIKDNIETGQGISIDWEGSMFEEGDKNEWIQERILSGGNRDYHRSTDVDKEGQTTQIILNFNIFVNRQNTQKTNRHYELRDILFEYFKIGTEIDLYDFSSGNFNTSLQKMMITEIITDQPIPDEAYFQYNFTIGMNWLEQW